MWVHPARKLGLLLAASGLAATVVAFAPGANATSWAGVLHVISAHFVVDAPHGIEYQVDVTATQSVATATGDEQRLYLDVHRCVRSHCKTVEHAQRPLASGDISVDPTMTTASLTTTVSGLPLRVTAAWSPIDVSGESVYYPGVDVYPLETTAGGPNPRLDTYVLANGTASLGSLNCGSKTVGVFTYAGVDRTGDDVRDPRKSGVSWPRDLRKAIGHAKCH